MKFIEYLNLKRNIIIILLSLNGFALTVNTLGIQGEFDDNYCPYFKHSLLSSGNYSDQKLFQKNFWPFVEFYNPVEYYDNYFKLMSPYKYFECQKKDLFKGIFRFFDSSEFFLYSILIILYFYIQWELKLKKNTIFSRIQNALKLETTSKLERKIYRRNLTVLISLILIIFLFYIFTKDLK
jgi:hypothetical protein